MLAIPNLISFFLLLSAVYFARKGNIKAHKSMVLATMLTSFVLVYMFAEMRLQGGSLVSKERLASFSLLFKLFLGSHIIAATVTFLLSLVVCSLGLKEVKKKWHKKVAYFMVPIWAYSAITGVAVYAMVGSPDDPVSNHVFTQFEKPKNLGPFQFNSGTDQLFTEENLKGHWTLLFFGYTHCPDICPMTLTEVSKIYQRVEKIQVGFITADPRRDTMTRMTGYVSQFNKSILPLRSQKSVENILSQKLGSKIVLEEENSKNKGEYSIFHPTGLYLASPDGSVLGYYAYPLDVEAAISHLDELIGNFESPYGVENARVAVPMAGMSMTVGYLSFFNRSNKNIEIVKVTSPDFDRIQLHQTLHSDHGAKMVHVESLNVPAQSKIDLTPGGYHLMLFGSSNLIESKKQVVLTLHTQEDQTIRVQADLRTRENL